MIKVCVVKSIFNEKLSLVHFSLSAMVLVYFGWRGVCLFVFDPC